MNYKLFIKELTEELRKEPSLPDDITFSISTGINGVKSRRMIIKKGGESIAPCIHLDYFYDEYIKGRSMEDIARKIIEIYYSKPELPSADINLSWDKLRDHISFLLINYEANRELLENMPHIRLSDLALIFRTDSNFLGIEGYIKISNDLMNHMEQSVETLFAAAVKNTHTLLPINCFTMKNMFADDCIDEDDIPDLLICTNKEKNYGAAVVFYDEFSETVREYGFKDYYIIPSSVHELLLINKKDTGSKEDIEALVREINRSDAVSDSDYLSDNVYDYDDIRNEFESILTQYLH